LFPISKMPWFANIANYFVTDTYPQHWGQQDR